MQAAETTRKSISEKPENVGFSAILVGFGTLMSRILGYLRETMIMAFFNRTQTDAWLVAFRLPNFFRRILGEGALSVSFIPVFVGLLGKGDTPEAREEAKKLASGIFTILLAILIPLTCLGIIFAEPAVKLLTPGEEYTKIAGKVDLTVHFARIMFAYILLVSFYAYFMAILNSLKKFLLPAIAPAFWSISMISSAFLPIPKARESGEILAWAVVVGGILQMGVLIPPLVKAGYFPKLNFKWNTIPIRSVFKALGPSILGLSVMQLTLLVNTRFASYLPEGAPSWIYLADRVLELPLALFAVSLGTALLPTLSRQWLASNHDEFSKTANFYLRSVLFLSIPASVGVIVLAKPIVEALFFHGKFSVRDVESTASVLKIYSLTVITASVTRVLAPCFYSIKNTWYPALCSTIALAVHIVIASFFVHLYGLPGLIGSTAFSAAFNMVLLFAGYKKFIGPFAYRKLFVSFLKFAVLAVVLGFVLQMYEPLLGVLGPGKIRQAVSLFITIVAGGVLYFAVAHFWGLEELKPTSERVLGKFRRFMRR